MNISAWIVFKRRITAVSMSPIAHWGDISVHILLVQVALFPIQAAIMEIGPSFSYSMSIPPISTCIGVVPWVHCISVSVNWSLMLVELEMMRMLLLLLKMMMMMVVKIVHSGRRLRR